MTGQSMPRLSRRTFLLRSEPAVPNVVLLDHCLAARGVFCECCRDSCDTGALRFVPQIGGAAKPLLDADLCTRCGECASVCPEAALSVRQQKITVHG